MLLRRSCMASAIAWAVVAKPAAALAPDRALAQYAHDQWTPRDGLPEGSVLAIHESRDGYLWLGTQCCLVRYDGQHFTRFDEAAGLKQNSFGRDLLEMPDGTLWAALVGGVARYANGKFGFFAEAEGLSHPFVSALAAESSGLLWVGTAGAGVWVLDHQRFTLHRAYAADATLPRKVNDLVTDRRGVLWAATDQGVAALGDSATRASTRDGLPSNVANVLAFDSSQSLWVGTRQGLAHSDGRPGSAFEFERALGAQDVTALLEDNHQVLWIGTRQALFRKTANGVERAPGEFNGGVFALATDHSGALWVGTAEGLERYRDGAFVTVAEREGLSNPQILNLQSRRAGGVYLLDGSGAIWAYDKARLTSVAASGTVSGDGMLGLCETRDGSLWIGGEELSRLSDGKLTNYHLDGGGIDVVTEDGDGLLLVQTDADGASALFRFRDGTFTGMPVPAALRHVQRLFRDHAGKLWISTGGDGLVRTTPQETRVFKVKDGLPSDVVYGIAEDADGTLWVATRAGLARIRGDQVSNLAKTANLPRRSPVHLQLDGLGSLWATADDGIYRIALNDLNRAAEHADRTLSPDVFTTRDGLASVEVSWRCSGQAVGGDGRIYYATARGLSFVNPRGILTKRAPPNPEIVKVSAAGSAIAWSNGATISDGRERLDFRYTSPDLDAPDALEFRYRLAGYDPDWVEARSARTAHYTNVPAGKYRFSVAVRRPSGEWSAAGASVQVAVLPRWYETLPARILLGFSGLLAAYGLYRIRVFYLRKNERVLRSKVAERTEELRREVAERKSAEERVQSLVAELDQRVRERTAQLEFANLATRRSEERYALAVQGAQDGLWDWDLMASHFYLSPRWKAMLGYEDHELMSSLATWLSRVHPDDLAGFRHAIEPRPNHPGQIRHEYRMLDRSGAELWMLCRGIMVFDDDGKAVRAAGSQTDITARKLGEAELRRKATHDALTGLPNRLLFGDRLEQALLRARPGDPPQLAVLFLDIDHFKTINDSIGHGAGDQVLAEAAQRIKSSLRETDTAARLGGDEFAVILPELPDAAYATLIADRIQAKLNAPFLLGERQLSVAASIGVRLYSEAARAEDVLRDADTAMYRAKTEGRARTQLFEDGMRHEAVDRLRIEAGLRRALSNDELVLYYQPLVSLESGLAVGVEALVRWQDPERGLLPPSEFIGVAEACGLIGPLSEWVLETAFTQARKWQAQYPSPLRVSVNIPPQLLNDPRLASKIIERLQRLELKPSSVGLEIVETSVLETRPSVLENLEQLRTHGIQLAIDDFGTGYSSFGYLRRLPVGCLKIDRAFTQNLPTNANDATICRTILAMAAELGLSAVAEGVERAEQADFLRASGCAVAQGYYFCRPLPAEDCTRFLDSLEPKARRGQNPDESRSGHIELH